MKRSGIFVCLCLLSQSGVAGAAAVYRCIGQDGEPRFQQHACAGGGGRVEVPPPALRWDPLRPAERQLVEQYREAERVVYPAEPSAARPASERSCWKKRRSLERLSERLRHGYRAGQGERLRSRRDDLAEYLRRYCE